MNTVCSAESSQTGGMRVPKGFTRAAALAVMALLLSGGCASLSRPPEGPPSLLEAFEQQQGREMAANESARLDERATLEDYLRTAFQRNPSLRAAFERVRAARERAAGAGALDDPSLSFEYFIEQMDRRYQVGASQMFPAFGTLGKREERAGAEARAAMHEFEALWFVVYVQVARAFHDYRFLFAETSAAEDGLRLLNELEPAAENRYRAGDGAFADVLTVRMEIDTLSAQLAGLRDRRQALAAALAALLNVQASEAFPCPRHEPAAAPVIDEAELARRVETDNPELKAAQARIEAERHGQALAERSGWPRLMVGASVMAMPGDDGRSDATDIGLMVGLTLPIWRERYRAERREAAARYHAAGYERDALHSRLRAELSMQAYRFRDAERRIELFGRSLIPRAGQALAVAREAYAEGRVPLMTPIDIRRALLDLHVQAARAAADREIALAELRRLIGASDSLEAPIPASSPDNKKEMEP
jgi:outer membrane protein, heavy metal efflux system